MTEEGTDTEAIPEKLTLRCWGTRGSIPSPGPDTARFGGNTTCFEVRTHGRRIIFDAGSGLRLLGRALVDTGGQADISIFLTHFHWDHIQGFPFFPPLYTPGTTLDIFGPAQEQEKVAVRTLFAGQMGPIYFPVPFAAVAATLEFHHLNEGVWEKDGIRVTGFRMKHPSFTVGYRIEADGGTICFIPDNELQGDTYPVAEDWRERLVDFVRGADLLIHDSMYTEEEYEGRRGWGHSTHEQSLRLAEEAGVSEVLFFHHAPERTDQALAEIVARIRDAASDRNCPVRMDAAREGVDFTLGEIGNL